MKKLTDKHFNKDEEKERDAFLKSKDLIFKLLKIDIDLYDVKTIISDISSKNRYDVLVHLYDNEGQKFKSFVIEIKVRNTHHNELLIQKKKLNDLFKYSEVQKSYGFKEVEVYYLNYTPKGTYLFELNQEDEFEWERQEHNKHTIMKENGTTIKSVSFLDIYGDKCSDVNYVYDYVIYKKEPEVEKKKSTRRCIFDSIK